MIVATDLFLPEWCFLSYVPVSVKLKCGSSHVSNKSRQQLHIRFNLNLLERSSSHRLRLLTIYTVLLPIDRVCTRFLNRRFIVKQNGVLTILRLCSRFSRRNTECKIKSSFLYGRNEFLQNLAPKPEKGNEGVPTNYVSLQRVPKPAE
ncbi:Uncharacterized protein XB17_01895 [Leptospira santarosai]|nr:Uncharacterized protein XB17_01895 [Leptospira santarosai]